MAYEWFQSAAGGAAGRAVAPAGRPATKGELDQLLEHLVAELDAADFFRTADRAPEHGARAPADLRPRRACTSPTCTCCAA